MTSVVDAPRLVQFRRQPPNRPEWAVKALDSPPRPSPARPLAGGEDGGQVRLPRMARRGPSVARPAPGPFVPGPGSVRLRDGPEARRRGQHRQATRRRPALGSWNSAQRSSTAERRRTGRHGRAGPVVSGAGPLTARPLTLEGGPGHDQALAGGTSRWHRRMKRFGREVLDRRRAAVAGQRGTRWTSELAFDSPPGSTSSLRPARSGRALDSRRGFAKATRIQH